MLILNGMEAEGRLSQEDYDLIFSKVPRLCVDIVIKTKEGVLLTLRDIEPYKGEWHLPGGRVMKHEPLIDAVKRIAKAETGFDIEIEKNLGVMEFLYEPQEKYAIHTVSVAFLTHPISGTLKTDWQGSEGRYFKELPENTIKEHKEFLRSILI
jgi:ADP-ribose pyrophosphatase YjhB (NUDIX family)